MCVKALQADHLVGLHTRPVPDNIRPTKMFAWSPWNLSDFLLWEVVLVGRAISVDHGCAHQMSPNSAKVRAFQ